MSSRTLIEGTKKNERNEHSRCGRARMAIARPSEACVAPQDPCCQPRLDRPGQARPGGRRAWTVLGLTRGQRGAHGGGGKGVRVLRGLGDTEHVEEPMDLTGV